MKVIDLHGDGEDPYGSPDELLLLPESKLGDIEVIRLLGCGKVSEAWFGVDAPQNREIVLKVLRRPWMNDAVAVALFDKTLAGMSTLNHPNLAKTYTCKREGPMLYWTMEWVKGGALGPRIRRKGPMDLALACSVIDQVAAGLAHARQHGVVHGALKPENLLIERSGATKVADLGVEYAARRFLTVASGSHGWNTEWMAPEVRAGKNPDSRSDIYSLGMMLFFMLTGALPCQGDTGSRVRIPGGMQQLLARMLAPKPEDRISDYGELRAEVTNLDAMNSESDFDLNANSWFVSSADTQTQPIHELIVEVAGPPPLRPPPPPPVSLSASHSALPVAASPATLAPQPVPRNFSASQSVFKGHSKPQVPTWLRKIIPPAAICLVAVLTWYLLPGDPAPQIQPLAAAEQHVGPANAMFMSSSGIASASVPVPSEIIVDDAMPGSIELSPADGWKPSAEVSSSYNSSSLVAAVAGPVKTATFYVDVPVTGKYEIQLWWVRRTSTFRSAQVPIIVRTFGGDERFSVDQVNSMTGFNSLGVFDLAGGLRQPLVTFTTEGMSDTGPNVHVSVDAVRLIPKFQ